MSLFDETHELVLWFGIALALITGGAKLYALIRWPDNRWLRLVAVLTCAYLVLIWALMLIRHITFSPGGVLVSMPAFITLLSLEIAHTLQRW